MPVKKVQQSVPTGAVAPPVRPPPVRPPPVWVPPRPPVPAGDAVEYPSEDGVPMAQSLKHARRMMTCFRMLDHWLLRRKDVLRAMDVLVYYKRGDNTESVAPDVFVSFGVPARDPESYKVWEEGKPPDVVWEFGSPSSVKGDAGEKKEKYRRMGVREYWLVDLDGKYHDRRLHGFELVDGEYVELPWDERPDGTLAVWSPVLQLEQQVTEGRLRFWDRKTGKYLELPEEEEREAREEADRAREEADRAREEAEARAASEAEARREADSRAASEAEARREADSRAASEAEARREADSRAASEAEAREEADRAREEAEARAASEAQAREAEMRKTKALEARLAELQSGTRGPRNPA